MHLEIPQLKSMGNTHFGRFSAIKPQTSTPVILYQFVAARPCYFWNKIQTFFRDQNFTRVRCIRTHASEISHLKLMGNLAFVCISTNKLYNPYPVILYKIVGSPPLQLWKKFCVSHRGQIGRPQHKVLYMHLEIPQLKSMGNTHFGRFSAIKP